MVGWPAVTAFAAVVLAVLSVVGKPRLRIPMRAGAAGSALLCAGFLAGPPFEVIAGGCVMALLVGLVLLMMRDGL